MLLLEEPVKLLMIYAFYKHLKIRQKCHQLYSDLLRKNNNVSINAIGKFKILLPTHYFCLVISFIKNH